jgi:hypothetical protein
VTGLLALCVLLLSGAAESLGLHACPHHTRIGSTAAAPQAHHEHGDHRTPAPQHAEHEGCTCASGCPAPGATLLPAPGESLVASVVSAAAEPLVRRDETRPARSQPYFLPYSQAPPLG